MKTTIQLNWLEQTSFQAQVDEFVIPIDLPADRGGQNKGPRPKPLMMVALAGCTAMDVLGMLKKMRVELSSFYITVEGETREDFPKDFLSMHVIYHFKGRDLEMHKLEKAVELSREKYCGVTVTLERAIKITHEIRIEQ